MIQTELQKLIRKLVGTLKSEDDLNIILKARLTKKEHKTLKAWVDGVASEDICKKLALDTKDYEKLSAKLIKKLNQEKLKQELVQ